MTITNTAFIVTYVADGVQQNFTFNFKVYDDVYVTADGSVPMYNEVINSDQDATPGGVIEFVAPPIAGRQITITRTTYLSQQTDYPPYTNFPAQAHERALDKLTAIAQESRYYIDENADAIEDLQDDKADKTIEIISSDTQTLSITDPTLADNVTLNPITNVPNGLVKLDGTGTIPTEFIPVTGGNEFPGDNPVFPQVGATPNAALIVGTVDPQNDPSIAIGPSIIQARADAENAATLRLNPWNGDVITGATQSNYLVPTVGNHEWRVNNFDAMTLGVASLRVHASGAVPNQVTLRLTDPDDGPLKGLVGFENNLNFNIRSNTGGDIDVIGRDTFNNADILVATFRANGIIPGDPIMIAHRIRVSTGSEADTLHPAFLVGSESGTTPHLALGGSTIQSKINQTTPDTLSLNPLGGEVHAWNPTASALERVLTTTDLAGGGFGDFMSDGSIPMTGRLTINAASGNVFIDADDAQLVSGPGGIGLFHGSPGSFGSGFECGTGYARLRTTPDATSPVISMTTAGGVELGHSGTEDSLQTTTPAAGSILINNLATGAGFERALTTSDLTDVLSSGDNVSELVNDAGYVDNVSNETVGGEKTLTSFTRIQYHSSSEEGTLRLGATLGGGSALNDLTVKRAVLTAPNFDNSLPDWTFLTANSNGVQNTLYFGFSTAASNTKPSFYHFFAGDDYTSTGASTIFTMSKIQADFNMPVQLQAYSVGTLPTVINDAVIIVSDGDAGSPCLAVGIGGAWVRLTTGSAVSTTSRGLAPITIDTASVSSVTLNGTHYGRTLYVIGTGPLDINLDATAAAGKFANVINHSSGLVQFVASSTTVNAPTNGTLVIPQFGTASAFGVTASIWQISGQTVPA